jgi:hypothetical protein
MKDPQPVTIPLDKLKPIKCEGCEAEYFTAVYLLRKLPALLSPTGTEQFIQIPVFKCVNCGTLYIDPNQNPKL